DSRPEPDVPVSAAARPEAESADIPGEPSDDELPGPRPVPPVVVPRWVQLVVLPVALLGLWALARAAGTVLLILIIASVIALILNPLIKLLERGRIHRGLAIFLVYLAGFGFFAGIVVLLADPVSNQVSHFAKDVPGFVDK